MSTSFKRLANKNFNCLVFLFKEIIERLFLVKTIVCSARFHLTFAKTHSLVLAVLFPRETSFPKSIYKVRGKNDADTFLEPS